MKTIYLRLMALAITCLLAMNASAQRVNLNKIKILSDSVYQSNAEYLSGNKYQKDAILFMDLVADTHPYIFRSNPGQYSGGKLTSLRG